jgi:nicotinamide-nucleotide adenylyltransferase
MNEYPRDAAHAEFMTASLVGAIKEYGSGDPNAWAAAFDQFREEHPDPVDVGFVIGRFQPAHDGHIYLIKMALAASKHIVIGIGSANIKNYDNPFSVLQRQRLLEDKLQDHEIPPDRFSLVHINDYEDDDRWYDEAISRTGNVNAVFGNNDWVNGIFQRKGIPTIEVPLLDRDNLQGSTIRGILRRKGLL